MKIETAKLSFIAVLTLTSLNAASDAPPERIAPHATGVAAYAQAALDAYGEGYAIIERAARLEEDARASTDHRDALQSDARLAYKDALLRFEDAIAADQRMYEAHTYIGYVHRKLGEHDEALKAYDAALLLKPDYVRAIEYQGEAFLGLDRFEHAKRNYLRLYALDSAQANQLLDAMHGWLAQQRERSAHDTPATAHAAHTPATAHAAQWLNTRPRPQNSTHRLAHW